jgi:menaquinone-dependent protoporphyrinogen oxidase
MARVLVVFHTSEGQAAKIAERIASVLRELGDVVDVSDVDSAPSPSGYDGVVVGDSIHAVKHSREMIRYLESHAATLNLVPAALYQVSLTSANSDEEHSATAHGMVEELLSRTGFDPDMVGLFAGALVYTQYGWLKRHIMRAIVKREGGDVDMSRDHDYTDWAAVERFAEDVDRLIKSASVNGA